jgi:hypothetical protein
VGDVGDLLWPPRLSLVSDSCFVFYPYVFYYAFLFYFLSPSLLPTFSAAANLSCSRQPWSAYAVHLTTLSPPALLGDLLLVWLCHKATITWGDASHARAMMALGLWMFTSKWIKLLGHYIRYPVDLLPLPISVIFGYFHGAIKMYAVMTLNVVSNVLFCSFPAHFLLFCLCFSCGKAKRKSGLPKRQPLFLPFPYWPLVLPMICSPHNALITTPPSCRCPYPPLSRV